MNAYMCVHTLYHVHRQAKCKPQHIMEMSVEFWYIIIFSSSSSINLVYKAK